TQSDSCHAGACVGSNPVSCTATDQCHDLGTCDTTTGVCSNPAKADRKSGEEGNTCTHTDSCHAGTCDGANPGSCTATDCCHDAGTCNTTTGGRSTPAKADGTSCNDGTACTQSDSCQTGVCVGSNPVTCTATDQCHDVGTCDTTTGICSNPAK